MANETIIFILRERVNVKCGRLIEKHFKCQRVRKRALSTQLFFVFYLITDDFGVFQSDT